MCVLLSCVQLLLIPWIPWSLPGSSVHRIFQAKILQWLSFSTPGDLPDQGSNPCLLCLLRLQLDSLPLHHLGNRMLWYCGSIKEEVCPRWSQEVFPEKWASVLDLNMHIQADGFAQNDSSHLAYILLPCWDLSILPAIYLSPFHEILTFQLEVT